MLRLWHLQVRANLGPCDGCPEDVNGDGVVNGLDAAEVYWSTEFKTPRISRHCMTAVAISGPGVQFRPPTRSMLPDFEDEGALLPARKSPPICAKHVFKQLGAIQRPADVSGLPCSRRQE